MVIGIDASRANVTERTGTERYAWEVIRRLVTRFTDHRVRLYVRESLRQDWGKLDDHVDVRILRWPPGILWSHLRLAWELLWHRPDVLFVPADTVPLVHPAATVTTIHDVAFERFPELYRRASVQRRLSWLRPVVHLLVRLVTLGRYGASEIDYHRWSVRHALRTCRRILTVSEFSKREIVEVLGADPHHITVTPIGVRQPEYFSALTEEHCRRVLSSVGCRMPFFLFLGRLEKKKNIQVLVAAYIGLQREMPDAPDLVLAGSPGYGWSEAEQLIDTSPRPQAIHVLGWQPDEVVDALQRLATALVFLSAYEGFGIPALESLSARVPVIANRAGSLPEVLGPAALFVDAQRQTDIVQAMRRIVADHDLRRSVQAAGVERVGQYTWDATADVTERTIREMLVKK